MAERNPSDDQAAFGVFPQLKRNRAKQDREAAKNVPVDLMRGAVSGVLGAPGDIESLVRMLPYLDEKTVLPTSEDIEKRLPFKSDTPVSRAATGLGQLAGGFYNGPGSPLRVIGALPSAVKHGAEEFAKASVAGVPHVIKPKGGNWLTGGVEKQLNRLKMSDKMNPEWYADRQRWLDEAIAKGDERAVNAIKQDVEVGKRNDAISDWIDSNLTNYVKKQMATPEDPVRKLAEEGVLHIQPYGDQYEVSRRLMNKRSGAGFPPLGMGKSEPARFWERQADISVEPYPAGSYKHGALDESILTDNPWLQNVPDETMVNYAKGLNDLGFDHVIDVLRQDVREGRIRPEQLNKVSMEQAVRRTHEYDQEMAKRMREAAIKNQEGFPLHKEYPEGYKWIELAPSKELPEGWTEKNGAYYNPEGQRQVHPSSEKLADALKYEGNTMGHCVGGYCPDVVAGRSRIFSLRDAKGEPHVTIETSPEPHPIGTTARGNQFPHEMKYGTIDDNYSQIPQEKQKEIYELGKKLYDEKGGDAHDRFQEAANTLLGPKPENIVQIKGKQNREPKAEYLPFVQDFVKNGKWTSIGDFRNTGLIREGDQIMTPAEHADWLLKQLDVPPEGMKRGGVAISKNPDTMMLELGNKRMKEGGSEDDTKPYFGGAGTKKYAAAKKRAEDADVNLLKDPKTYAAVASFMGEAPDELGFSVLHPDYEGVRKVADPAYGLGIAAQVAPIIGPLTKGLPVGASIKNVSPLESSGVFTKAMAKADAERALPLVLPRAMPKSLAEINAHAERVARQMMGEHVTSGKAGDTTNLAGRSMKESQRVKNLDYEIVPTKDVPESQVYQPQIGDINVALPGDFTLSDVELKSLQGEPIGSHQQGGSRYGLGHLDAKIPLFYASNEVPAQGVQNKVDDLYNLFGPERVMGHHMAMGPVATNFAQHFADANLRYTDYSKLRPQDMYQFDKIISEGFVKSKKDKKTGETIRTIVDFPDWPGIADPQAAFAAMESNPEMRKWYNRVMQTPKITSALNLPSGLDVRYAITSPDLRDMEVNLTGHGVGRMKPGATLTDTANHNTYAKGIQGIYEGHQDVLSPFPISFADATQHIITNYSPKDFTGTIQKVFPHQRVDQQYLDELGAYRKRIKELTGKKKGGTVHKAQGGAITGDDLIIEERPL